MSRGTTLGAGWLIQSPNVWGMPASAVTVEPLGCQGCDADLQLPACAAATPCSIGKCVPLRASIVRPGQPAASFCLGHSDALIDRFYDPIAAARHVVDIALIARTLLFGVARHSIRIIQQDVAFAVDGIDPVWPDAALERISDLITQRGGDVYIVLSNLGAAGAVGHYSYGVRLETVANYILEIAAQRSHLSHRPLVDLMCQHLHLAPMRFGPYEVWPNNHPIAVHAKFWVSQ
ncbi:MAG: hypothetical protein ACXWNQ_08805 [Anaerolineales bacterium]